MGKRIIITDDEPLLVRVFAAYLSKAGYEVIKTFDDGDALVQSLKSSGQSSDILILDYRMPKMDGLAAAKILKPIFPQMKIVLCSAYPLAEKSSMDLFDAVLQKPVSGKALVETISELADDSKCST